MVNPKDEEINKLKRENEELKEAIRKREANSNFKIGKRISVWLSKTYLGKDLSGSINNLINEISQKKVSNQTVTAP